MDTIIIYKRARMKTKETRLFIYEQLFLFRHNIWKQISLQMHKDTIKPDTWATKNENGMKTYQNLLYFDQEKYIHLED